jgi:hypothetical protein
MPKNFEKQWRDEAARAAQGAGLLWRCTSAWLQQGGTEWSAEFTHVETGKTRTVTLCSAQFSTPAARRDEIVQQLQAGR